MFLLCCCILMERIFWLTPNEVPNRVLTAHIARCATEAQYIVRVGGCLAVVDQWQSTSSPSQMSPGFNSW